MQFDRKVPRSRLLLIEFTVLGKAEKDQIMNKQKIFVFRISKGNESGNPVGKCPLDYSSIKKTINNLNQKEITPIDYNNNGHLGFIFNEFWKNRILRQGWGIKDLDLNQDVKKWIENYMLSGKIYWDTDINCDEAKGRWNILRRIPNIKKGDILLIPKTSSSELNDYFKFTACQVEKEYYFDYPTQIQDFGHCLKVKNIKEYQYGLNTLNRNDFGTPYLWAVTEVKNYHSRFDRIKDFVENEFSVSI